MAKREAWELKQMQAVPLQGKIAMTQRRIREWYDHFDGQVYVSFSGGKDSTVLKHIVDSMFDDVPAVFVNTGLEYPEIQNFVRDVKSGKYNCFNTDVQILRPEIRFDQVISKYGYPVISKEISERIYYAKQGSEWAIQYMSGANPDGSKSEFKQRAKKYAFLVDSPIPISHKCCTVMKKSPAKRYEKETGRKPILATMACESNLRKTQWTKVGCNAFDGKRPRSAPMSFWTEQDVLHYIKKYNIPYASVYGDIVFKEQDDTLNGQMNITDYLGINACDPLETTGCDRTGCIFCMFGAHLDETPNRFQRLKETHPKQYDYCINGGEMVDGKWQPNKEGLGLGYVLDYIGVKY